MARFLTRRAVLHGLAAGAASVCWSQRSSLLAQPPIGSTSTSQATSPPPGRRPDLSALSTAHVPVTQWTTGPAHHWFGYYDKWQFDTSGRRMLTNEVTFEHRSPTPTDTIRVGVIDRTGDAPSAFQPIATTAAWGWQQGCMLQWRPGHEDEVIFNDRDGERFVCRIHNLATGRTRTIDRPIYTVSPDGKTAVTADFARIQSFRPGYGYAGVNDPFRDQKAPKESGIWRVDLETGESSLIVSLADIAAMPHQGQPLTSPWHWFNHLLISPDGSRTIFLHRWRDTFDPATGDFSNKFYTRMFTVGLDGNDLHLLDPSGFTSHFVWRDAESVCMWTRPEGQRDGFYLFQDKTDRVEPVGAGVMTVNGHNTYLPETDNEWILNDTYPKGPDRQQTVYLYHVPSGRRVDLGSFHSPSAYQGEWRCDTHPRASQDGRTVAIDSPHTGEGRQQFTLDVSSIVDG